MIPKPQEFSPARVPLPLPFLEVNRSAVKMVPVLALYAGVMAGTAGAFTSVNIPVLNAISARPVIEVRSAMIRKTASLHGILDIIRSTFGLTMTELAAIFDVSRPTAYAWLSGATPKGEVLDRIWQVHGLARHVADLNLGRTSLLKRRPLSAGRNLLQALTAGQSADAILEELQTVARLGNETRGQRGRVPRTRVYNAEDISFSQHGES